MDSLRPAYTLSNDDIEAVIQMATSSRAVPRDTRTQLFVGNLPYRVRWQDLKDLFRRAGTVLRADVSLGPDNRSRGYGTVLLATADDAARAIDLFNGYNWQTRILEVRHDRLSTDRDELDYSAVLDMHHMFPGAALDSRSLFVGNLPFHCQWQDLKDLFRQAGTIMRADVVLGQDGRSRGFGSVIFATEVDAGRAVKMFNGYEYNGRTLKVNHDKHTSPTCATLPTLSTSSLPALPIPTHPYSGTPSSSASPTSVSPTPSTRSAPGAGTSLHARLAQVQAVGLPMPRRDFGFDFDGWGKDVRQQQRYRSKATSLDIVRPHSQGQGQGVSVSSHRPHAKPGSVSASSVTRSSSRSASSTSVGASETLVFSPKPLAGASTSTTPSSTSTPADSGSQPHAHSQSHTRRSPAGGPAHRPGPITLPPPPPASAFPLHHQHHSHSVSVIGFSPLHPAPLFHQHPTHTTQAPTQPQPQPPQNQPLSQQLTPHAHGLPPITPSMPPFTFLAPLPSPGAPQSPRRIGENGITRHTPPAQPYPSAYPPITHNAPYAPYGHPLPSPLAIGVPVHMGVMQNGGSPGHPPWPVAYPFGITPVSPPGSATALPTSKPKSHKTKTHHASSSSSSSSSSASSLSAPDAGTPHAPHHAQPPAYAAFSPGIAMSPGAFWGGAPNPLINPAVGAPVHRASSLAHTHGHSHKHLGGHGYYGGQQRREPAGYFDFEGYFPPVYHAPGGAAGGSGLVNEIMKESEGGSVEREREGGGLREEEDEAAAAAAAAAAMDGEEVDRGIQRRGSGSGSVWTPGGGVRRHSSSNVSTPWQTHPAESRGDMRGWEGRVHGAGAGGDADADADADAEEEGDSEAVDLSVEEGEAGAATAVISRTHSMSAFKTPFEVGHHPPPPPSVAPAPAPAHRSGSDPALPAFR